MPADAQPPAPNPTDPPHDDSTGGAVRASSWDQSQSSPVPLSPTFSESPTRLPEEAFTGPLPQARLGKYELLEQVAVGGMGVIFKAFDARLSRVVALKTIRAGLFARPEEVQRFYAEARAVARLKHPHVVPIYEVDQQEGQHFFVMEFAAGGTLAHAVRRFAGNARAAAAFVRKVALAVQCAHGQGILHRDLKPSNILLDGQGEPLVSDFGLARFLRADPERAGDDATVGTPAYMAPEQAAGRNEQVGPATDVWALGVILYELLAGKRPFPGKTSAELKRQILETEPPRLRLDRDLETIVLRCLMKDPAARYATADALAEDLGRWLAGEPLAGQRRPWPSVAWRFLRRQVAPLSAAALACALALFVVEAVATLGQTTPPQDEAARLQKARDAVRKKLTAGEDVVLVGPTATATELLWRAGPEPFTVIREPNTPLRIETHSLAMLPLLPDPQIARYRLEAEACQIGNEFAAAGFYFGYQDQPSALGTECWHSTFGFFEVAFARTVTAFDQHLLVLPHDPKKEGSSRHMFQAKTREWVPPDLVAGLAGSAGTPGGMGPVLAVCGRVLTDVPRRQFYRPLQRPWRKLAIEVEPGESRAYWEGRLYAKQTRPGLTMGVKILTEMHADLRKSRDVLTPPLFAFSPRGGLGLYVPTGRFEFRNVVLKPLPQR